MIAGLFFYLFALMLLVSAVLVVTIRQPVPAVLFLILCFFNAAALFLLLGAEFLAFIMLIVYVGAVAVLFLFVVMMLDMRQASVQPASKSHKALGFGVGAALLAEIALAVGAWPGKAAIPVPSPEQAENTRLLGRVLYTDFVYPFQVGGLILLVAMIGAIALTLRDRRRAKKQSVLSQLDRRRDEVVQIRKVKSGEGAL